MQRKRGLKMLITQISCSILRSHTHHKTHINLLTYRRRSQKPNISIRGQEQSELSVMAFREMVIDETDDIESYSEPSLCLEKPRSFLHSSIYPQDCCHSRVWQKLGTREQKGLCG